MELLADENVDYRVVHRLENYGHDVVHVDDVPRLGKGTTDAAIVDYVRESDRLLLTNDDFLREFDDEEHAGLLFVEDEHLPSRTVADVVDAIARQVPRERIDGTFYVGRNWL